MMTATTAAPSLAHSVELRLGLHYTALAAAFCRWRAEYLFGDIFFRNKGMTLPEFLDWNYRPTVEHVGCYVGSLLVGMGWICQVHSIDGKRIAEVGVGFFEDTPYSIWRDAIRKLLDHGFRSRDIDIMYAIGDGRNNRAARVLPRVCGMTQVAHLPWEEDVPPGTIVHRLTRADWMRRR